MAQVEKNENFKELKKEVKKTKSTSKKESVDLKKKKETRKETNGVKDKLLVFFHGVKTETKRIHWPTKKEMIKYSVATVVFVLFFALFFYIIDVIFALIHSLIK